MATSPNFGWLEPDNTDLVKNGALAIRTLGNAIDASLAELKGGTTGQVLSKTSNTDMDFTWVAQDDSNAIQNALLTTTGDTIYASGASTPARLGIGSTGQVLTVSGGVPSWATPSAGSSGSAYVTGKNIIINGGMDIWQRGTSIACSATAYTADRWQGYRGVAGATVSRQTSSLTLAGIQYCARVQRDSGNTSTSTIWFSQAIETANSYQFANKAVVFSFYARAGANYSAASSNLNVRLRWGTGTDQNPLGTWTGGGFTVSSTATLTTSWQRFTFTGTVDATATELATYVGFDGVGTAGAADYFEITGVQLEQAASVTDFSRAGATIQGELAACQRYFWNYCNNTTQAIGIATFNSTIQAEALVQFPVAMRTAPTLSITTGTSFYYLERVAKGVTTLIAFYTTTNNTGLYSNSFTGLTAGQSDRLATNSASASISFSAEL